MRAEARGMRRREMDQSRDLVIQEETLEQHEEAVRCFLQQRDLDRWGPIRNTKELAKPLELAVGKLRWEGEPTGRAGDLLSGVQHFLPQCRKRLVGAWQLSGEWNRVAKPDRAPPMDRALCLAVAEMSGEIGGAGAAAAILLTSNGCLRTGSLWGSDGGRSGFARLPVE